MAPDRSTPAPGDTLLMVGTMKGAFLFWSTGDRAEWRMEGPHFRGETVYSLAFDPRGGRRRMLAGTQSFHWGSVVRASDDFGETWSSPERQNVRFPEETGLALANIWQLRPGRRGDDEVVYAGVEPAALFSSNDGGETFSPVEGLLNHEHRPRWMPGGGGLCLHTIVLDAADPRRMGVAISTAGFYRTDDGGQTWHPRNQGVRAQFLPDKYPEFGQCVHKVVNHPSRPERLYLQNHWGLYRSDDWGDSWHDIANGVPSDFGFAMEVHPRDPETVYIVPLESDEFRCVPEAKLRVYRTRDGGGSWHALENGLPQEGAYETVLRDAMAADAGDPAGIYFGTRGGKLYGSADDGDTWREIADALPPIVCVKAATIAADAS
ncbi:MAG TPA: hypothetical protein VFJ16_14780 [Longimicrobium sp.]|nr:hypothetical protein [Longimicrobium sp.]